MKAERQDCLWLQTELDVIEGVVNSVAVAFSLMMK